MAGRTRFALAAFAAATMLQAAPAAASLYCDLAQTSDGFVALRDGPDVKARLIARMTPEDTIQLLDERKGRWQRVLYWREGRFDGTGAIKVPTSEGWLHEALIAKDSCG